MSFWFSRSPAVPRTIFIGDVHGCLEELRALIRRLRLQRQDRVILLGDLINRGPEPAGVVQFVAERGFESLMGNHDLHFVRNPDANEGYAQLHGAIGPTLFRWLEQRPFYLQDERFIAVHAGLQPGRHPANTPGHVLANIRTWDGKGKDLNNPQNPPWYEFYARQNPEGPPVFYGHWARAGLNVREKTVGLDSGCVYGRALSACILETREIIQIPAKRQYYIPPSLRKQGAEAP